MSVLTIPRVIRERIGDDASEALATLINDVDIGARRDAIAIAEERFERRLTEETSKLRVEISKVNERITEESGKLHNDIANTKAEIIKWMFLFWIGQTAVLIAIIKFLVVK